jgi:hypothetical protein
LENEQMQLVTYRIVEHDGGFAYTVDGVFSETFASYGQALRAAQAAAREQSVAGETTGIRFEDANGQWHDEIADGHDRPVTDVEG